VRILFLALDVDLSGRTGDSTHVRELATSLSNIGNEVSLVGYFPPEFESKASSLFQGTGVTLNSPEARGNLATLRFGSSLARRFKPDIIYERRFSPKIGVTLGKISGIPSVVEINAMVEEEKKILDKDEGSAGLERIKRRIRRYFLRSAARIVVVSGGIRDGLVEEYDIKESKVHVVHNGANTDIFRPLNKDKCKDRLGLDGDLRYVCFSGNLAPWQGLDHLIPAFAILADENPDLRLLMVGDGVLRQDLERMVKDHDIQDSTIFSGRVSYEDVPLYINSSEICVAPFGGILRNIKYGFSAIKLYEYMGCGKPFVTTTVCGIQDEITKNDVGVVVPPDDPEELAGAATSLLKEDDRVEQMGERARALAVREHSWNSVAKRITNILEGAIGQRGS
jgi:glycosyltransferase involved in cell wall biosynthesis